MKNGKKMNALLNHKMFGKSTNEDTEYIYAKSAVSCFVVRFREYGNGSGWEGCVRFW